jgi:hypothetical protein
VATESTALLKVWVVPVIAEALKQSYFVCNDIGGVMHYHFSAS